MKLRQSLAASVFAIAGLAFLPSIASAASFVVDGTLDAGYSGPAVVGYDPSAPTGNFQSATNVAADIGYSIYTGHDASYWYGFFQPNTPGGGASAGTFANLYFDIDPANGNGSDLGFELSASRTDVFVPGISGSQDVHDILFSTLNGAIEVGIPIQYFTTPVGSLSYYPGQEFLSASNPTTILRLSQTFGYSVAGGPSYGTDRLGAETLIGSAVPEPATWAMLLLGFFGIGFLLRAARRNGVAAVA